MKSSRQMGKISQRAALPSVDPVRSAMMRAVPSQGTTPELAVRKVVRQLHHRSTYNCEALPGHPDIVVWARRSVVFVHGCFWHGHKCARGNRVPRTNRSYWIKKIQENRRRHRAAVRALRKLGWSVATVWECRISAGVSLSRRLARFLDARPRSNKRMDLPGRG